MSEWKKVKLGELYEVHNGLSKGRQFFGSGYPFYYEQEDGMEVINDGKEDNL